MKKIALIMLSEPLTYPPTLNAANILAENGWHVDIYGIKYVTTDFLKTDSNVKFHYFGNQKTGLENVLQYILFYFWIFGKTFISGAKVILSYDPMSVGPCFLVSKGLKQFWFYHVHDVLDKPKGWYKIIKIIEKKFANKAHNISFPQTERAEFYAKEIGYNKTIDIVFNGPRKNWGLNKNQDLKVQNIKKKHGRIIVYQGGISKNFNFEPMLKAMKVCKSNFAICFIGRELEMGAIDYYLATSKNYGLEERVYFLNPTDYDNLPTITSQASIGIGKFTTNNNVSLNDYYLIGASNKITEYLAMSLPVLLPKTPINSKFLSEFNIGLLCEPENPIQLAISIDSILLNQSYENELRLNAKTYFDTIFNFDEQFQKILIKLENYYESTGNR